MKRAEEKRRSAFDVFRRRESAGSAAGFHGSFRLHHRRSGRHGSPAVDATNRRHSIRSGLRVQHSLDAASTPAPATVTADGGDGKQPVGRSASAYPVSPLATTNKSDANDVDVVVMRRHRGVDNPGFQPEAETFVEEEDDGGGGGHLGMAEAPIARRPSDVHAFGKEERMP